MNINNIIKIISLLVGKKHRFVYSGSRGLYDEFEGEIVKLYPRIFIIKTIKGEIKAFTYSDYAIKNLRIN